MEVQQISKISRNSNTDSKWKIMFTVFVFFRRLESFNFVILPRGITINAASCSETLKEIVFCNPKKCKKHG